jgi:hypothetical protein
MAARKLCPIGERHAERFRCLITGLFVIFATMVFISLRCIGVSFLKRYADN